MFKIRYTLLNVAYFGSWNSIFFFDDLILKGYDETSNSFLIICFKNFFKHMGILLHNGKHGREYHTDDILKHTFEMNKFRPLQDSSDLKIKILINCNSGTTH